MHMRDLQERTTLFDTKFYTTPMCRIADSIGYIACSWAEEVCIRSPRYSFVLSYSPDCATSVCMGLQVLSPLYVLHLQGLHPATVSLFISVIP